jgi:hypothetical protein
LSDDQQSTLVSDLKSIVASLEGPPADAGEPK